MLHQQLRERRHLISLESRLTLVPAMEEESKAGQSRVFDLHEWIDGLAEGCPLSSWRSNEYDPRLEH